MKRSRRRRRSDLGVAADVATDDTSRSARPPRGNRYAKMKLPHERDQSTDSTGEPNPVTTQGATDVAQGKRDTDCYDAAAPRYDREEKR
ncbi:MAG TPA: hypothetical protein VJ891_19130 [Casimicrobiaceae bacterium]|nr:hypothetical protein [Casimicrobiaceae bacterium]